MRLKDPSALLAVLLLTGCERVQALIREFSPPTHPPLPRTTGSASASPSASLPAASARLRSLDAGALLPLDVGVRRAMKVPPLRVHGPGLAFGRGRLGVFADDALVVRDLDRFEEITRVPLHDARTLVTLSDGSFLVADGLRTLWLAPHDVKARSFPHLILLPGSAVFPDRQFAARFWVTAGPLATLYGYEIAPSDVGVLTAWQWIDLDGYDGRAFGSMRDGSFLYTTATGFRQFSGTFRKDDLAGDSKEVFRLLAASRVDTVWVMTRDGAALCRALSGKLYRLQTLTFDVMPFDVVADGPYLAVLELLQPSLSRWTMLLEVFDIDGKRHLKEPLTTEESFDPEQWFKILKRNRRLALVAEPPMVAVGGPEELHVWDAETGKRLR